MDPAADDRCHGGRESGEHGDEAQEFLRLRSLEQVADHRTADNHADTGADSLQAPKYEQGGKVGGEGAADRGQSVNGESCQDHRAAAHGIRQWALHQGHDGQRQHVDRQRLLDGPLAQRKVRCNGVERRKKSIDRERTHHGQRGQQCRELPISAAAFAGHPFSLGLPWVWWDPRRAPSHSVGLSPRSRTSTNAEPTTTPSTWPRRRSTCSRLRIPNPAQTGTLANARTRSRYPMTSAGTATFLPVVPVIVTAYTKPWLLSQSCFIRSGLVTGVTIWTIAIPCASSALRRSLLSSNGKSGTMNPVTCARTAASARLSSP